MFKFLDWLLPVLYWGFLALAFAAGYLTHALLLQLGRYEEPDFQETLRLGEEDK